MAAGAGAGAGADCGIPNVQPDSNVKKMSLESYIAAAVLDNTDL